MSCLNFCYVGKKRCIFHLGWAAFRIITKHAKRTNCVYCPSDRTLNNFTASSAQSLILRWNLLTPLPTPTFRYALSWRPIILLRCVPGGSIFHPQSQNLQCCCERKLTHSNHKIRLSTMSFFLQQRQLSPVLNFSFVLSATINTLVYSFPKGHHTENIVMNLYQLVASCFHFSEGRWLL